MKVLSDLQAMLFTITKKCNEQLNDTMSNLDINEVLHFRDYSTQKMKSNICVLFHYYRVITIKPYFGFSGTFILDTNRSN